MWLTVCTSLQWADCSMKSYQTTAFSAAAHARPWNTVSTFMHHLNNYVFNVQPSMVVHYQHLWILGFHSALTYIIIFIIIVFYYYYHHFLYPRKYRSRGLKTKVNKKAQLSLTNPRDAKACQNCSNSTFLQRCRWQYWPTFMHAFKLLLRPKSAKSREIHWKFKLMKFKVIQGHRYWRQSKAHMWLAISH